jgi:hypothetical protein
MAAGPMLKRFEALSLRERAMVVLAMIGGLVALWDTFLMSPLRTTRIALEAELASASAFGMPRGGDTSDPRQMAITRAGELQTQLQSVDTQLANSSRPDA